MPTFLGCHKRDYKRECTLALRADALKTNLKTPLRMDIETRLSSTTRDTLFLPGV